MGQVWKTAPGVAAEDWDLFREHGCIGLGWLVNSDYRDFGSEEEVLAALEQEHGKGAPGAGAGSAKMIWQFVHDVKLHHVVVANERYNRVVGVGVVASEYLPPNSAKNPIRKDTTTHRHHVRRVDWLITESLDLPSKRFFVQSTLWPLGNDKLNRIRQTYEAKYPHLRATLEQLFVGYQAAVSGLLPEEVGEPQSLVEGALRQITVNAYERNPVARQKCLAAHGTTCCICGFNFGAVYGPEAEGYIHVHHLRALSEAGGEYEVDPVEDLRPVCPNCHAVLHLGGECRSIYESRRW
jgi:predicted HNH restriction endonuclease